MRNPQPILLEIAKAAPLQRDSIVILHVVDEQVAIEIAHKIADATGRSVTVKDEDMIEIQTIPAVTKQ